MNLREISIEEARDLPSGHELWVGQTRQTTVKGRRCKSGGVYVAGNWWEVPGPTIRDFKLKLFTPTPDAVPIEPDEAAARMVRGEPVEWYTPSAKYKLVDSLNTLIALIGIGKRFRIPAIPQKQRLVIEVDAGVEVPDKVLLVTEDVTFANGTAVATVISRGGAE